MATTPVSSSTPERAPEPTDDRLNRAREAYREFMSVAVHDLREPLRTIGTSSDLLEGISKDWGNERAAQCLHFIQEGVDRMDLLLRDIAEYCHAEGRELKRQETSMEAVLGEAQRQLSGVLRTNDAILTHDPLPDVTGDFFALATVLRNLISNACRFRSAEPPCIHVGSVRHEAEWRFWVRDNGIGFKLAYADAVFQPFKRLNGKQFPGSGLGLPFARRIVGQHGGRIWAESVPGDGSTFWFSLPVRE